MTAQPLPTTVLIFGKDTCPYTDAAREDYARRKVAFEYINVKAKAGDLARMLEYSGGARRVPVIVEGGKVTIGFGGT
jgi:glutaredoxin 3